MKPEPGLELQGRYQLVERIALGGMGEVWRATDLRSGRAVAAKILRPELAGDEIFLSRLRAEAANSRGLRHPNLAVVLDSGERHGSGWIVMELVQGRALSDILAERGAMPPEEILPILAQVARALQVVHDSGVVHRDVKPSNILINREGLAKLTDFGISMGVNQRPMTATGMVMGTAQYLAPEQAMGNMATPSGDLYALGVIAYEALAGHRPFTGSTQVDIAFAHVNQPVPPLPDHLPAEVREVVMELLAKKPADRPRSARELARRLDRIVINLPAESWDPREAPTWTATGRIAAAVSAVATDVDSRAVDAAGATSAQPADAAPARTAAPAAATALAASPQSSTPTTRTIPAADRTRTAVANASSPATASTRHASGRERFGLPAGTIRIVVTILILLMLLVAAGTLASAHSGASRDHAVVSTTSSKEAL
ncbi:serine/threonine-protein kinase [Actinomyces glycerinitolerans]|uniref:non-specific serine/threonine protein kinase n=1 Tax=Actinomyces glycerinitolerans TaxID=1892869 RepID=A0A1M4S334_9ACTO|nr:serine/threonine-protein kinase [Actinomyces glycerinitolerans]SHE26646.1 serine/threonine-protein kinase active site [Actinomyces glycerinitolerans]